MEERGKGHGEEMEKVAEKRWKRGEEEMEKGVEKREKGMEKGADSSLGVTVH